MLKLLGAGLLLGGGLLAGLGATSELSRRVKALESWRGALGLLEGELAFRNSDLSELLARAAVNDSGPAAETLTRAGENIDRLGEAPFSEIWREALSACDRGLNAGDLDELARLGEILGRYEAGEQQRLISTVKKNLEERLAGARADRAGKGRVYSTLGLAFGALAAILLW